MPLYCDTVRIGYKNTWLGHGMSVFTYVMSLYAKLVVCECYYSDQKFVSLYEVLLFSMALYPIFV